MKTFLLDLLLPPFSILILFSIMCLICLEKQHRRKILATIFILLMLQAPVTSRTIWALPLMTVPVLQELPLPRTMAVIVPTAGAKVMPDGRTWPGEESVERALAGKRIADGGDLPLLIVGGKPGGLPVSEAEATAAALGWVAGERLLLGTPSLDSCTNATEAAGLLAQLNIREAIVVTNSLHLPRFAACLRAAGLNPAAPPAVELGFRTSDFLPSNRGIALLSAISQELLGMVWYLVTGRLALHDLL